MFIPVSPMYDETGIAAEIRKDTARNARLYSPMWDDEKPKYLRDDTRNIEAAARSEKRSSTSSCSGKEKKYPMLSRASTRMTQAWSITEVKRTGRISPSWLWSLCFIRRDI